MNYTVKGVLAVMHAKMSKFFILVGHNLIIVDLKLCMRL